MADESYVALSALVQHLQEENGGKAPTPRQLADALEMSVKEAKDILAELQADPPASVEPAHKKPKKEPKAKQRSGQAAVQHGEASSAAAPSEKAEMPPPTVPASGFEGIDDGDESPAYKEQPADEVGDTQLDASPTASEKPVPAEKPVPPSTQVALTKGDSRQFLP